MNYAFVFFTKKNLSLFKRTFNLPSVEEGLVMELQFVIVGLITVLEMCSPCYILPHGFNTFFMM